MAAARPAGGAHHASRRWRRLARRRTAANASGASVCSRAASATYWRFVSKRRAASAVALRLFESADASSTF